MFKYMILLGCVAYATARPDALIAAAPNGAQLYSALPTAPLSPLPLTYAAGPIALGAAGYYNPIAYAAPYPYPAAYTAYNLKSAPIAYTAIPAGTLIQ